jgi:hypothetical protein
MNTELSCSIRRPLDQFVDDRIYLIFDRVIVIRNEEVVESFLFNVAQPLKVIIQGFYIEVKNRAWSSMPRAAFSSQRCCIPCRRTMSTDASIHSETFLE